MFNLLTGTLPTSVEADGIVYPVETDFRTMIEFERIITHEESDSRTIITKSLELVFTSGIPANVTEAFTGLLYIYSCGKPANSKRKVRKNGDVEIKEPRIYDFEVDAPYIYGAFLSHYGIDLQDIEYLHWWKFHALFMSLPKTEKIVEIMSYRATDASKIEDKAERQRIAELQRIYALPQSLTPEEKVAMAGAAFAGGF